VDPAEFQFADRQGTNDPPDNVPEALALLLQHALGKGTAPQGRS